MKTYDVYVLTIHGTTTVVEYANNEKEAYEQAYSRAGVLEAWGARIVKGLNPEVIGVNGLRTTEAHVDQECEELSSRMAHDEWRNSLNPMIEATPDVWREWEDQPR